MKCALAAQPRHVLVNLTAEEIEDGECFPCLQGVKPPVNGLLVMTSQEAIRVVEDCADCGIRRVWMYRGWRERSCEPEAVTLCSKNGTQLAEGCCPFMFLPAAAFPHRAHGLLMKLTGAIPLARLD